MLHRILLSLLPFAFLSACTQFEKNVEADQNATSLQSLDNEQSQEVDSLGANGQINSYEEQQMQEAINGQ